MTVYVFQMGKVGSTSTAEAVRRAGFKTKHAHSLKPIILPQFPQRTKVITCVREPIARNISMFFHMWSRFVPELARPAVGDTAFMVDCFLNRFDHLDVLRWYRDEFLPATGVDLLYTSDEELETFDHGIDILCLRAEDSDLVKQEQLREFLDAPQLTLHRMNQTRARDDIGEAYNAFVEYFEAPRGMVSMMRDSQYVSRFGYESLLNNWA